MFAVSFSYFTSNFHATASSSPFSSGLQEVREKINFPNMFVNTMFASVYAALHDDLMSPYISDKLYDQWLIQRVHRDLTLPYVLHLTLHPTLPYHTLPLI